MQIDKAAAIWIQVAPNVRFSKRGVSAVVTVWARPEVEEFIKRLSGGMPPQPLVAYGRQWIELDSSLSVYPIADGQAKTLKGTTLDRPGQPLISDETGMVNMSFLRLVGISGEKGVSFGIDELLNDELLDDAHRRLVGAADSFYQKFLRMRTYVGGIYPQAEEPNEQPR